jgi:8-oxo-dGTP pyrophosphatase MutT (NUDIX family)
MYEETGLAAKNLKLFNVFSGEEFYYKLPHGDEVYNVTATYICDDFDGKLRIDNEEVVKLGFFDVENIPSNISPPDRPVIKEFITSLLG